MVYLSLSGVDAAGAAAGAVVLAVTLLPVLLVGLLPASYRIVLFLPFTYFYS